MKPKDNPKTTNKRKLSADDARWIRQNFREETKTESSNLYYMCHKYGVSHGTIRRIIQGTTYKEAK